MGVLEIQGFALSDVIDYGIPINSFRMIPPSGLAGRRREDGFSVLILLKYEISEYNI